jgi:hypothetical protein
MRDYESYLPPFQIGQALEGAAVGEVLESNDPEFRVGDIVLSMLGWREVFDATPRALRRPPAPVASSEMYLVDIVVFNGHVHTTEVYEVDGVKYLVLGGGGAEQDPILPGRTHITVPDGYPLDQYWKGGSPKEDYNFLHVEVKSGQPTTFVLNRFRPWSATPFETVELYK